MTDTRRLLIASAAGSVVEWYDFFVFASAAALALLALARAPETRGRVLV